MKLGCVVMAAGNASRFGSNKLLAEYRGKPLFQYALEALPCETFEKIVVVSQYPELLRHAKVYGFTAIENNRPNLGQSHSIHLGLAAVWDCDAVLFQVADQPNLRRESIAALIAFYRSDPDHIAGLAHEGQRGNPCIFPARFFPELMDIRGDRGGNVVIRQHPEALRLLEVDASELRDVDTPEILAQLK